MFNSIKGLVTYKDPQRLYLDMGGLEWDITISRQGFEQLPGAGEECRVFTYLYVREDRMIFYGFVQQEERRLFLDLITVESIGPSLAMKILSGIKPRDFIQALDKEDLSLLTSIPGLGKKTAQKIIFKLRGKLSSAPADDPFTVDITAALTGMGFDPKKAKAAVLEAVKEVSEDLPPSQREQEVLKLAIKKAGNY